MRDGNRSVVRSSLEEEIDGEMDGINRREDKKVKLELRGGME